MIFLLISDSQSDSSYVSKAYECTQVCGEGQSTYDICKETMQLTAAIIIMEAHQAYV